MAVGPSQVRILPPAPGDVTVKIVDIKKTQDAIAIAEAAAAIRAGGLVIYPTETVYGLGADACSDGAVAKVFSAKHRPPKNPIPIAVGSFEMARMIAESTPAAERLFAEFLPGPLMVVLPAKPKISKLVTAGTGKVGIRVPDHPVALRLIDFVGGPITATSANLSGKPAPRVVEEALEQIGLSVAFTLDAGKCKLGVPSTVVDLTSGRPRILREGPISAEKIKKVL